MERQESDADPGVALTVEHQVQHCRRWNTGACLRCRSPGIKKLPVRGCVIDCMLLCSREQIGIIIRLAFRGFC